MNEFEKENILEEYLKEKTLKDRIKTPKFWAFILTLLIGILLIIIFYKNVIKVSMSAEEVAKSIRIMEIDSIWVDKKVTGYEVIIVPTITFKIKNIGTKPLQYVYFEGVFEFVDSGEKLSDGYTPALKDKPLNPGEISDEITIKSYFGYRATSKEAFIKNIKNWKKVKVKIFAKTQNSQYALLGIYHIKQKIKGIKVVYK